MQGEGEKGHLHHAPHERLRFEQGGKARREGRHAGGR
jgi:hypothetical protein